MATQTPWGKSQHSKKIARGINFYSTARHGGIKVSKKLNESMPAHLRIEDGWYEEDCDYARVVLAFPQFFTQEQTYNAIASLKEWNWETYEIHFNRTLQPGESNRKDQEMFVKENENNYQVICAMGSWHEKVEEGYVLVYARKPSIGSKSEKAFIVPEQDYATRKNTYGIFIVDENKYPEVQKNA